MAISGGKEVVWARIRSATAGGVVEANRYCRMKAVVCPG